MTGPLAGPVLHLLGRIKAAGIPYRSTVRGPVDHDVGRDYGGRNVYWNEPEGHQWEMLTSSYARQPNPGRRAGA